MKELKLLGIFLGVIFVASCTQLTNFDMPEKDVVQEPDGEEDIKVDDVKIDDVRPEEEEVVPECGNLVVDEGEECDDGKNGNPDDGCKDDCTFSCHQDADCNNGNVCDGEETCNTENHRCESGTAMENCDICSPSPDLKICLQGNCVAPTCGDGCVTSEAGEFCEPPNEGGCDANCHYPCTSDSDCHPDSEICNGEEFCNTTTHLCDRRNVPAQGSECGTNPRQICIAQVCQESVCGDRFVDTGATPAEECDDGNTNPDDGCKNDCTFTCHNDNDCLDSNICNGAETCNTTTHICQPGTNASDTTPCDDGLYCTINDHCNGSGTCVGGGDRDCSDSLSCTSNERCNEDTDACIFDINSGTCLIDGVCYDDGDSNPSNSCQECDNDGTSPDNPTGWTNRPNTYSCDDGQFCTINDHCDGGTCVGSSRTCSDISPCATGGVCNENLDRCDYTISSNYCLIDEVCYANNDLNPDNSCQECDNDGTSPDNPTGWTNLADNTPCDDNNSCTTGETCTSGVCGGGSNVANGTPCDDGNGCSMLDVCTAGTCGGTTTCTASPIFNTVVTTDHRVGICVPDSDVPASTTTVKIGASWQSSPWTPEPMADCDGYWAYTSPSLSTGIEQCYKFCKDSCTSSDWFYGTHQTNCGSGHCGGDNCGFTITP